MTEDEKVAGRIPLKDPQAAAPTLKTIDGVTLDERPDGLILVHDPDVQAVWSFSTHLTARRVHRALEEWMAQKRREE